MKKTILLINNALMSVSRKRYLIAICFLTFFFELTSVLGQTANNYQYSTGTGAVLEGFTTGNSTSIMTTCYDDDASGLINIGFNFVYEGTTYTQFSVNSNGLMRLGGTAVNNSAANTDFGTTSGSNPKIAPLWDDLWTPYASSTANDGWVRYKVSGSSPNRILIVDWRVRNYSASEFSNSWCGTGYNMNNYSIQFQSWLYETSGVIEFKYGTGVNQTSSSIGISGVTGTNYLSVTSAAHTASNSATKTDNTAWPGSGRWYRFTGCVAPTEYALTGGGSCVPSADVGLSGSQTGVNYQLKRNGVISGSVVAGTGSAISFGTQTNGSYTVDAIGTGSFCTGNTAMPGSVSVVFGPNPITGATSICTIGGTIDLDVPGETDWASLPTGGNITTVGNDRIHAFTSGTTAFANIQPLNARVLVVAGGGGGGRRHAGGGGAGGVVYNASLSIPAGSLNAVVGTGGGGGTTGNTDQGANGANGQNSSFGSFTAIGGGWGAGNANGNGNSGGSGGGGCNQTAGGNGTAGQGNKGGNHTTNHGSGCGGGGAGAAGANANATASVGGVGVYYGGVFGTGFGQNGWFGGGGGGGINSNTAFAGGNGGGGAGGVNGNLTGVNGLANTGGGGGGGGASTSGAASSTTNGSGGSGGSGIVLIRYSLPWTSSNPAVATVNGTTGLVTAVSNGSTTITYTNANGCSVSTIITVGTNLPNLSIQPASQALCEGSAATLTATITSTPVRYRLVLTSAYGAGWHGIQEIRGKNAAGAFQTLTCVDASSATYSDNVLLGDYRAAYAFDNVYNTDAFSGIQWLTPKQDNGSVPAGGTTLPNTNWQNYGTVNPFPAAEWIEWTSPQILSELEVYNGRYATMVPESCFKDYYILMSYDNGVNWTNIKLGAMTSVPRLNTISLEPTYVWKKGGSIIGSGKTLNIASLNASNAGIYTLEASYAACGPVILTAEVILKNIPAVPLVSATPAAICISGTSTLEARGMAPGRQGAEFNGTSSEISLGNHASLQITGSQTIEMWIKPVASINRRNPYNKAYAGEGTITLEPTGDLNYYYGIDGTNGANYGGYNSGAIVPNNQWSHIAMVRDLTSANKTVKWYINGVLTSSSTAAHALAVAGTLPVTIGNGYAGYFGGQMDNVRVWNVARTHTQIVESMYLETPVSSTGLVAHYTLNGNATLTAGTAPSGTAANITYITPNYYTYTWSGGPSLPTASTNEVQTTGSITTSGTHNYAVTATAAGACAGTLSATVPVTVTTANPANVVSATGATLTSGDFLWNGNTTTSWVTMTNWYQYNGSSFEISAATPTNTNRVFILPTTTTNTCISSVNNVIVNGAGNAKDVFIGLGASMNINAGQTLDVYGNWTNNGIFTPDASAIVAMRGGIAQSVGGTSASGINFTNLVTNKTGNVVILAKPVTVSGTLTMTSGNINTTSTNLLTVGTAVATPGSLSWTGGTVVGPLRRFYSSAAAAAQVAGIFPVGNATYNRYAQVNFTSANSVGSITCEYVAGIPAILGNGLPSTVNGQLIQNYEEEGYWSITPSTVDNTATYNLVLRGNTLSPIPTALAQMRIIKSRNHTSWDNTGIGSNGGATGPLSDFTISNSGMTGFSWFNIGSNNAVPLPVTLKDFSASCKNGSVKVRWSTASEQNSEKFIVEKSRDMNQWIFVSEVAAAGNSNIALDYTSADDYPFDGISYYRLVQVDLNGAEKTYGPVSVSCEGGANSMIVFPNPSKGDFTVEIMSTESVKNAEIQLADLTGKLILNRKLDLVEGNNQILFEETSLQMGTYIVRLLSGDEFKPVKLVVN